MARYQGSVAVTGFIAPTDTQDTFATHDSVLGRGGLREIDTLALRDAIPDDRRRVGMIVFVLETGHYYSLIGDLTNLSWRDLGTTLGGTDELQQQITELETAIGVLTDRVTTLEEVQPTYEIAVSIASTLEINELLFINVLPYSLEAPTDGQCLATALQPADSQLTVMLNGVLIGLVTFSAGSQEGSVFFQQDIAINKGDILTIIAPDVFTMLADVGIHLTFNIRELT